MNVLIEYNGNEMHIGIADDRNYYLIKRIVDGLTMTGNDVSIDWYSDPSPNTLNVLNNCVDLLKVFKQDSNPYSSSLQNFINEMVIHKEYCNPYFLESFGACLNHVLKHWVNGSRGAQTMIFSNSQREITPDDLKLIYAALPLDLDNTNGLDYYTCNVSFSPRWEQKIDLAKKDDYLFSVNALTIQIAYSCLMHHFKHGEIIKRCENCGRLFIPKRISDKYCTHIIDGKTCGMIRKAEDQRKSHNKDLHKQYKRIYNRLYQQQGTRENDFATDYKDCKTDEDKKQCLEHWNEISYKRKPKPERQDTDHGEHETK